MPYDSRQVANAFLDLAKAQNKPLTNMQLQKLVFLAQGFSLALQDEPITFHNIHAWQWGPVLPKLYKACKGFGNQPILEKIAGHYEPIEQSSMDYVILKSIWENYGQMTGGQLSNLTHEPGSPWDVTWKTNQYGIIENDVMKAFYREQLNGDKAED